MLSKNLDRQQVQTLFNTVQRHLNYYDRLEGRMLQKHFPVTDPLFDRVKKARSAIAEVSVQLHQLFQRE